MKKIKLFVDAHWFDDLYQSTCVFLKGLYSEVIKDDRFDVYMAAVNIDQLKSAFNHSEKITYIKYKHHSKYYRLAIDIPLIIHQHKIDIAHYQYISPLFKTTREIVTIHDILFRDFKGLFPWQYRYTKDFLFKRSAKRAECVTTVSQYSYKSILSHYKVDPAKLTIIPNGIASEFFDAQVISNLPDIRSKYGLNKYLLFISRIEPRKNHLTLLKAYSKLKLWERGVQLVFIGRTDIVVPELNELLDALPAAARQHVVELKNIPFKELMSFYKEAEIFIYPSIAEGFGIPPLESAALETKTICSNSTAMNDFSFFGSDLVDPMDSDLLAEKIIEKLVDNDRASRKKIAQIIHQQYNWTTIAASFMTQVTQTIK